MCSGCAEVERLRRLLTYWLEVEAAMTDGPTFHRLVANFSRLVKQELESGEVGTCGAGCRVQEPVCRGH